MIKTSILLAEDNNDLRSMLQCMLENEGFNVIEAKDGALAWQWLSMEQPDVVVTDLMMPYISGLDLIKHIRTTAEISNIPIVAMTAYGSKTLDEAQRAGATSAIRKPEDLNDVVDIIKQALAQTKTGAPLG